MKEFYMIAGIDATKEDFEKEGYKVISFGAVKKTIMEVIKDRETYDRYNRYNYPFTTDQKDLNELSKQLQKIVFKESRGGGGRSVIGWENANGYLTYHSGIGYKWFKH